MRITNRVVTEKYLRSVNEIQTRLDYLNSQVYTGRKFTKVSEDTPAAVKAFQIRRDLRRIEGYESSLQHAQGMLSNTETSISTMQELVAESKVKILYGMNDTQSVDERRIIANELRNMQHEMLQRLNSNAAGLYYFGGSNVEKEPFSIDSATGKLQYRWMDGETEKWIKLDDLHETPQITPPATSDPQYDLYRKLSSAGLFVDIGMGVRSDDVPTGAASPYVDRNSVFTYTLTGITATGVGTTALSGDAPASMTLPDGTTQISNNIYDLLGTIADVFENYDDYDYGNGGGNPGGNPPVYHHMADELYGLLEKREITLQYAITEVGTKLQYLDFIETSLDSRKLDDTSRQQDVEGADPAETIIYFKSQQMSYEAALMMGTSVLPMSIFNYMQ
jgi:flagellar hook-associated protein 3 FlgL